MRSSFLCHNPRRAEQLPKNKLIIRRDGGQARNHPLRHHQHMHGRFWIEIVKREHVLIFPNNLRWDFSARDFLEDRHVYDTRDT